MSKWWHISANSEILLMTFIGLATTVMEGIYMNFRDNIKEVWILTFPEELFSTGLENLVKTILCGIIVARGATVHAALASYLLIIYPVITEKLRIMLVVWMVISALRGILINIVATCTGCVLCAAYPDIRPVCFEFAITKAVELACSIFMWVNVNDFYHSLKSKQRNVAANTDVIFTNNPTKFNMNKEVDQDISSGSFSLSKSFFDKFRDSSLNEGNKDEDPSSINSFVAKTTFEWFIKKVSVLNDQKEIVIDEKKAIEMFVEMSTEDLIKFQQKLKTLMDKNESKESKLSNSNNETGGASSSSNKKVSTLPAPSSNNNNTPSSSNKQEAINISASSNNKPDETNSKQEAINISASSNNKPNETNSKQEAINISASSNNKLDESNTIKTKLKAKECINKLLLDCIMIAINKFENNKTMPEESERKGTENKEGNNITHNDQNQLIQQGNILRILRTKTKLNFREIEDEEETFDENEILQEIDQTTVVRSIYERKSLSTAEVPHRPTKKIIWRASIAPTSSQTDII
ncbi:hypothetical protein O3M35_001629 [Rhynocoris fuscipes]|uniref:Uncharacterized protein n=1 Tax=Rhynocoris fuscipes TaxID=488301 RepID=A0AAW1CVP4_9HEMI